jgi:hypothetical protein
MALDARILAASLYEKPQPRSTWQWCLWLLDVLRDWWKFPEERQRV